ncbi:hypothetical protein [Stieleria mannarensis]|uniref:hypothetical protein n=1 Tax=Stieleria mannarensis TaxID=2755585 RepID=UPI001601B408|nr:hypothetical protein [Rhodopirellula sp. JC639]
MSTIEHSRPTAIVKLASVWQTARRHRVSVACVLSAAIMLVAAIACTTIQTRDSVFDPFSLQVLVSLLSCTAASNLLIAFGMRHERFHFLTWGAVVVARRNSPSVLVTFRPCDGYLAGNGNAGTEVRDSF